MSDWAHRMACALLERMRLELRTCSGDAFWRADIAGALREAYARGLQDAERACRERAADRRLLASIPYADAVSAEASECEACATVIARMINDLPGASIGVQDPKTLGKNGK
jgi:hypothetical protein